MTNAERTPQRDEFLASEGNSWFERNAPMLAAPSPMRSLVVSRVAASLAGRQRAAVLEIGCGRGDNLHALGQSRGISGHGLDPSAKAIEAGRAAYPQLELRQGTADTLPFADASFDLVWFGFCLYLVDRSLLQRAVAEADRVLRDGGLLAIVDFDPDVPSIRPYHHRAGLSSYKMDYSRLFLANPAYVLAEKISTSHETGLWSADPQDRVALTICRKDLAHAYRQAPAGGAL